MLHALHQNASTQLASEQRWTFVHMTPQRIRLPQLLDSVEAAHENAQKTPTTFSCYP
jgi:hypothetical protein